MWQYGLVTPQLVLHVAGACWERSSVSGGRAGLASVEGA